MNLDMSFANQAKLVSPEAIATVRQQRDMAIQRAKVSRIPAHLVRKVPAPQPSKGQKVGQALSSTGKGLLKVGAFVGGAALGGVATALICGAKLVVEVGNTVVGVPLGTLNGGLVGIGKEPVLPRAARQTYEAGLASIKAARKS